VVPKPFVVSLLKPKPSPLSSTIPFNLDEEVKKLKAFSECLTLVFKESSIKSLHKKATSSFISAPIPEFSTTNGIDSALAVIHDKSHYYHLNKVNQTDFHGMPGEDTLLYNYHQTTIAQDRKLRVFPGLPIPQTILDDNGFVNLAKMRLDDANYIAIRDYINAK
jgi:hypothetical protein